MVLRRADLYVGWVGVQVAADRVVDATAISTRGRAHAQALCDLLGSIILEYTSVAENL